MSSSKTSKASSSSSSRKLTFFVPGDGIDREVISTDICRYLGNDATTRPGDYTDTNTGELTRGYFITAYRALTTEQLADIKADSIRWNSEKKQPTKSGVGRQSSGGMSPRGKEARRPDAGISDYRQSTTRKQQQQWVEVPHQEPYPIPVERRAPIHDDRRLPSNVGISRGYEPSAPQRVQPQLSNQYLGQSYSEGEPPIRDLRAPPPYSSNTALSRTPNPERPRSQPVSYSNYPATASPQVQYGYSGVLPVSNALIIPSTYPQQQPPNISSQYVSANGRDIEMYEPEELNYRSQEPPPSVSYRTATSRQEPLQEYRAPAPRDSDLSPCREETRRDDRSERHRDDRRRR